MDPYNVWAEYISCLYIRFIYRCYSEIYKMISSEELLAKTFN